MGSIRLKILSYVSFAVALFSWAALRSFGCIIHRFTVVGYGLQGVIKPFAGDTYARYKGTVRLIELKSTFDGGQSGKFTDNPGLGGGSCFGDSGGPIFYGTSNMVTAIVSWGITPCIGADYNFRVDTPIALDSIHQFVP